MAFLRDPGRKERPDLVLLDLEMPRMPGREVLAAMRADEDLATMPVVIFSSSAAGPDVEESYRLAANSYVSKPIELDDFLEVVRSIEEYWLTVARLPGRAA
jgi:CheY-like chemotaxis protein